MPEAEFLPLSDEERLRAQEYRTRHTLPETYVPRETLMPIIPQDAVQKALTNLNLGIRQVPWKDDNHPFVRAAHVTANYFNYLSLPDGDETISFREVCRQPLQAYFETYENPKEAGAIGVGSMLYIFQHHYGDEFLDKVSSIPAEDAVYAMRQTFYDENQELAVYATRNSLLKRKLLPARLPAYQIHLHTALDALMKTTTNDLSFEDGFSAGYQLMRLVWGELEVPPSPTPEVNTTIFDAVETNMEEGSDEMLEASEIKDERSKKQE